MLIGFADIDPPPPDLCCSMWWSSPLVLCNNILYSKDSMFVTGYYSLESYIKKKKKRTLISFINVVKTVAVWLGLGKDHALG